jgi:hypothetical protein
MIVAFFSGDVSTILDVAALAAIFGSFLAYTRMKSALLASESAGKAWHEERDAEKARAERLALHLKMAEEEKLKLLATVASLETRPDLSRLEGLVMEQLDSMKRHEEMAATRTDRLIAAVESLAPAA